MDTKSEKEEIELMKQFVKLTEEEEKMNREMLRRTEEMGIPREKASLYILRRNPLAKQLMTWWDENPGVTWEEIQKKVIELLDTMPPRRIYTPDGKVIYPNNRNGEQNKN